MTRAFVILASALAVLALPIPASALTCWDSESGFNRPTRWERSTNLDSFQNKIDAATPGTAVRLADGTYTNDDGDIVIEDLHGTSTDPIWVAAENLKQARIAGSFGFKIKNSTHIVLCGFHLTLDQEPDLTNGAIQLHSSEDVTIWRNYIDLNARFSGDWDKYYDYVRVLGGKDIEIAYNDFRNGTGAGRYVNILPTSGVLTNRVSILYNDFDNKSYDQNGGEAVKLGNSTVTASHLNGVVSHNYFHNLDSDAEVVSVKSSYNTISYNTFRANDGSLVLRHGHHSDVIGNWFKDTHGGIRVHGEHHKVYNNYIDDVTGTAAKAPLAVYCGDTDSIYDSGYERTRNSYFGFNTIINADLGIDICSNYDSGSGETRRPQYNEWANNLIEMTGGELYLRNRSNVSLADDNYEQFLVYGGSMGGLPAGAVFAESAPDLIYDSGHKQYYISNSSPARDNAASAGTWSFVTEDADGHSRSAPNDIGADEYGTWGNSPEDSGDVGYDAPWRS